MQPLPRPAQGLPIPQVVLLAGLLLSAMLAGVVWSVGRSKNAALRLVDSTTRELRYSEQRFRSLASASPLGIFGLAPDGRCEYVNERLLSLTERSADELTGDGLVDAFHADDRSALRWAWADASSPGVARLRIPRRDGTIRWVKAHAAPLRGDGDALKGWVGSVEDITSEVEAQDASQRLAAQLAHRARHDHLTGLPNRAYLMDKLSAALNRHRGLRSPLTLLFFDLDRFKVVNDSLGHEAGDRLLAQVAERLSASLRPGDLAARFGGDEFVVCLTSVGSEDAAVAEAERIMAAVCHPVELGQHEVNTTVSMGLAVADADVDAETLLTRADDAMYRAKDNGKARIEVYRPAKHARGHGSVLEMERDLREAIDGERLHLLYQPLVVISSGAVVGAEALVRWRHPERGLLPPAEFIALAEDSGLIVPLGTWVLRTACAQLSGWRRRLDASRALTMTVNVSARQLADPAFSAVVATALSDFNTDPTSLTLEITESALLHDVATGEEALESLRRIGVRIAVDDFGTGYSSLSRLNVLPVDMLKIDRSFVADIGGRGQGTAIVAAVVRLAAALGLTSVAEGVERAEQMDWLASVGCDLAQGYHLARPAEPEVVEPLLSAGLASYSGTATRLSPV